MNIQLNDSKKETHAAARLHRVASKKETIKIMLEKRFIGYYVDLMLLPHDAIVRQLRGNCIIKTYNKMKYRQSLCIILLMFCISIHLSAQNNVSTINKLTQYVDIVDQFSKTLPQEKVYLHFDNSTYYQGDDIWFSCYLVTSGGHEASMLSKTLYVELLNPGGEVIETQILKVENGRCHGSFKLGKLPFYSGFYEVRAYTKYMLNFGDDVIFSRTFAVYDTPKKPGDYQEKNLMKYGRGLYPILRPKPVKEKTVSLKFFPEGGNLVNGVPSRIAFEATDAYGNPIEVSGAVVTENKETLVRFKSVHDGRGVFSFTPSDKVQSGDKAPKIIVDYNGKKYNFDLPTVLPKGIVLKVDNLSSPYSIGISVLSNSETPKGIFGLVLMSGSALQKDLIIDTSEGKPIDFKIDKTNLPAGVSRIILFDAAGQIVADRLLFVTQMDYLAIKEKADKASYKPYEQVNMQFGITDQDSIPVETTFSVSIRDKQNDVKPDQDIQSNLLLMSEIKGYVHNPDYYFESDDLIHQQALDLLLMVQGWHRYSWNWVNGTKPFELKHQPEKGIEINGQVVSFVKSTPKPNVNVSTLILQKNDSTKLNNSFTESFVTDSLGRFSFTADVEGRWDMVFAVTEKGKKKDHRTVLDKLFSPEPKRYRYTDLFAHIPSSEEDKLIATDTLLGTSKDSIAKVTPPINYDSIAPTGGKGKVLHLKEVVVKAKKSYEMEIIDTNRARSMAYYDVYAEQDKIRDKGGIPETDLKDFLLKMNKDFYQSPKDLEDNIRTYKTKAPVYVHESPQLTVDLDDYILKYKTNVPLFVVDYKRTSLDDNIMIKQSVRADYIKSIYISENPLSVLDYFIRPAWMNLDDPRGKFSCVVFLEMFPEWKSSTAGKGVRKTWLDGYSQVKEFYSPNYSILPSEPDYRRTLYWNPSVKTDEEGKALIQFYNNSSCRSFSISAETITPQGVIGVLK